MNWMTCKRPPKGWHCGINRPHLGPCPTRPNFWTRLRLWLQGVYVYLGAWMSGPRLSQFAATMNVCCASIHQALTL